MRTLPLLAALALAASPTVAQDGGPWPWVHDDPDAVSILLMGDTNVQLRDEPETAFRDVMPTLAAADLRLLNLEGPFAGGSDDRDDPDVEHKNWRHSDPDQVAALTAAGIDAVGVANNVTYPREALMRSLAVLDAAGIPYAGGGENLEAAHRPVILTADDGTTVGFLQYAATVFPYNHAATPTRPGVAEIKVHTAYQPPHQLDKPGQPPVVVTWFDEASKARMVEDVRQLAERVDVVVTSYHWGVSGTDEPVGYQTDIAHAVIDAGADVVMGHGPHRYQQVEVYRGRPVFYSLAQGVFDDIRADRDRYFREGLLARLTVEGGEVTAASLVPTWRDDDNQLRLYDPTEGKGRELFGVLLSVNRGGAPLALVGREIQVGGVGADVDRALTTDRTAYAPGDAVALTLRNASTSPYSFEMCAAELQIRRKGGAYRGADGGWRHRACDDTPRTVGPGEGAAATITVPPDTPPGTYRVILDGRVGETPQAFITEPFEIGRRTERSAR
jgi:poly-gamma-glutamate synthesis protein (capsule biosynthesis protein)